jgi:hypothetical protein
MTVRHYEEWAEDFNQVRATVAKFSNRPVAKEYVLMLNVSFGSKYLLINHQINHIRILLFMTSKQ